MTNEQEQDKRKQELKDKYITSGKRSRRLRKKTTQYGGRSRRNQRIIYRGNFNTLKEYLIDRNIIKIKRTFTY